MFEDDYILDQIRRIANLVLRMLDIQQKDTPLAVDQACQSLVGLSLSTATLLDRTSLERMLGDGHPHQRAGLGMLLLGRGIQLVEAGSPGGPDLLDSGLALTEAAAAQLPVVPPELASLMARGQALRHPWS